MDRNPLLLAGARPVALDLPKGQMDGGRGEREGEREAEGWKGPQGEREGMEEHPQGQCAPVLSTLWDV